MQIYQDAPRKIGKNLVISNTEMVRNQTPFLSISPRSTLYNTLGNELGMYLIKVGEDKLTFRTANSLQCGEFGQNHLDLNLYHDRIKDNVTTDLGVFRTICANGMEKFDKMEGIRFDKVFSNKINPMVLVEKLQGKLPLITNRINKIQAIEIDQDTKDFLVQDFLQKMNQDSTHRYLHNNDHMKFGDINSMIKMLNTTDLLHINRVEDSGNNLWTTYNTIQENSVNIIKNFKPTAMVENKLLLDTIKPIYA